MTQTTVNKHRTKKRSIDDGHTFSPEMRTLFRQVARAIESKPERYHRQWLALLVHTLREEGLDVELLECALAEQ